MRVSSTSYNTTPNFQALTIRVNNAEILPEKAFRIVYMGKTSYGEHRYPLRDANDYAFVKFTTAIKPTVICARIKKARETSKTGVMDLLS